MNLSMDIIAKMMNGITQSKEWNRICMKDPGISAAQEGKKALLEKASHAISFQLYDEILDAIGEVEAAYADAAILYGMHVAFVLQQTAAHPEDFSRYAIKAAAERRDNL